MTTTNLSSARAGTVPLADVRRRYLPTGAADKWRRNLAGYALGWPWFDGFSAWALRRWFFPASRLWAAAQLADGSLPRFYEAAQLPRRPEQRKRLEAALARFEKARARAMAVEAEWQRVFFGPEDSSVTYRSAVEAARLDAMHGYNAARRYFAFLVNSDLMPVVLETQSPDQIDANYGATPADFAHTVDGPMPAVEASHSIPTANGTDHWLRFRSPSQRLGDTVYARVLEPAGISDPPTLILGHGICVEFDHWHGLIDEANSLRAAGFRVIRPEAPWHGRRTPRGRFGGERLIASFPAGLLDAFAGALQEWAVLADWSRRTSRGPLAFGGTSLGAQMALLAAGRASAGPEPLRPDGLFLVTHSGSMADAVLYGDMTHIFGRTHDIAAKGWTPERLKACLGILDPHGRPALAPERIVSVLGSRDRITPSASALSLIDAWRVPAENRFVWDRGHFSMPMTLIRDPRPIERFRAAMGIARTAPSK